jgi:hypothetical protein
MAKRWPAIKKRPAAKCLDSLPGRKWSLGAAAGKTDLGAEGGDSVLVYAFNWKKR